MSIGTGYPYQFRFGIKSRTSLILQTINGIENE